MIFNENPLVASSVELAVENLLPRSRFDFVFFLG